MSEQSLGEVFVASAPKLSRQTSNTLLGAEPQIDRVWLAEIDEGKD